MKKQNRDFYEVVASYGSGVTEQELDKLVGRPCDGGGFSFDNLERDASWSYKTARSAIKCFERLNRCKALLSICMQKVKG